MSEKEYIVILHRNVDFEQFNQDMIASTGSGAIPNRSVDVTNPRPGSQRMTHYSLTDKEATELKSHPSVFDVEIPPWNNPDLIFEPTGSGTGPSGNFRRHGTIREFSAGEGYPWFFPRHGGIVSDKQVDPYLDTTTNLNVADYNGTYTYTNSGEGVDIVIQDTGIDANNIEFTDSNGVSRVQKINWATESGVGSFPSAYLNDYYRDWDSHGTHVASTAAGRSMGWAKDARIYAQKLAFGAQGSNIEVGMQQFTAYEDAFDQIKEWHKRKPIESNGFKRPTIVNMSWTTIKILRSDYIGSITHRGRTYSSDADLRPNQNAASDHVHRNLQYGFGYLFIANQDSGIHRTTYLPGQTSSILVDVEELIDAGVHVCVAAANSNFYISKPGHIDYDNSYTIINPPGQPARTDTGTHYNHRGSSPMHPDAHIVGSIGSGFRQTYTSANIAAKSKSATGAYKAEVASSSGRGPGVNIYHPGASILGASSQAGPLLDSDGNVFFNSPNKAVLQGATEITNPLDSTEKLMKFSGTSMASPGVAGILACILEDNPGLSPAELKEVIATPACGATIEDEIQEGFPQTDDFKVVEDVLGTTAGWYSHLGAVNGPMGGPNRMIFNSPTGFNVSAAFSNSKSPIIAREISGLEMAPDEAIVSLYELELFSGTEPLYFHSENTEDIIKFNNGTGLQDYEAFPILMEGIELRGDGAQPRPKVKIPNVESLFLSNSKFNDGLGAFREGGSDFQIEDLIGKRLTRRQTLSKYVQVGNGPAPTNAFQLPKATYVIDRISGKTSLFIELELASPFDLQNIKVPSRAVTGKYCPWIYKALTTDATDDEFDVKSACHWQSLRNNALLFFTIDNEPVVHTSLLGTTAYSSGATFNQSSIAFINNQYFQSMKDNNTATPSETDKINWRRIRTYTHWNNTTSYTIDTSDERNNSYVYDLDTNNNPTLWKALAPSTGKVPRDNSRFWVQADVCGKLLSSCKSRYQTTAIADTTLTNVTSTQPLSIADRDSTASRLHGIPSASFDNNISLPFGGFPGTRRIR